MSWSGLFLAAALTVASPEKEAVGVVSAVPPVPVASTVIVDSRRGDNPAVGSQTSECDNSYENGMDPAATFPGYMNLVQGKAQASDALQGSNQVEPTATQHFILNNRGAGASCADLLDFKARIAVRIRGELHIERHDGARLPGLTGSMDTLSSPQMVLDSGSVSLAEGDGFQDRESTKQRVVIQSCKKRHADFESPCVVGLSTEPGLAGGADGIASKDWQIEIMVARKCGTVKSSDHDVAAGILDSDLSSPTHLIRPVVVPAFGELGRRAGPQCLRLLRSGSGILWNLPEQQPCLKGIQV